MYIIRIMRDTMNATHFTLIEGADVLVLEGLDGGLVELGAGGVGFDEAPLAARLFHVALYPLT
jgi:hypothetical protein